MVAVADHLTILYEWLILRVFDKDGFMLDEIGLTLSLVLKFIKHSWIE
jgi:hypothetical protein